MAHISQHEAFITISGLIEWAFTQIWWAHLTRIFVDTIKIISTVNKKQSIKIEAARVRIMYEFLIEDMTKDHSKAYDPVHF